MSIAEALLPEFDQEMASTRKMLERIPESRLDWKPHDKSLTFSGLATHIANLPSWIVLTMKEDRFDISPPGGQPLRAEPVTSVAQALQAFEKNVAEARAAIERSSDAQFLAPWSLLKAGQTMLTLPRVAMIRTWVMNHLIHHRGQFGVYLRLNDVAVPSVYGPTADEEA